MEALTILTDKDLLELLYMAIESQKGYWINEIKAELHRRVLEEL